MILNFVKSPNGDKKPARLKLEGLTVELEVSRTDEERERGLMGRERLAETQGMIFLFDDLERRSFWMKNVSIPLDIIFLEGDKIVEMVGLLPESSGPVPSYQSNRPADRVIELRAGTAKKFGLSLGQRLLIEI